MTLKEKLYAFCWNFVQERIDSIQVEMRSAQVSANEETKSSAGDKYETGRAMAQGNIERNARQLQEAEKLKVVLDRLSPALIPDKIVPGSLITTSHGVFYIAISIGLVTLEQQAYFIVSADSPVGKGFLGKTIGDIVHWKTMEYFIKKIE
jgi:transcription elongation GreA/GreB family factor